MSFPWSNSAAKKKKGPTTPIALSLEEAQDKVRASERKLSAKKRKSDCLLNFLHGRAANETMDALQADAEALKVDAEARLADAQARRTGA